MVLDLMDIINEDSFAKNNNDLEEKRVKKLLSNNLDLILNNSKFNFEKLPINPALSGSWLKKLHSYLTSKDTKLNLKKSKYSKVLGHEMFISSIIELQNKKNKLTFSFTTPYYVGEANNNSLDASFIVKWIENDDKTIYTSTAIEKKEGWFLDEYLEFENWTQKEFSDIKQVKENSFNLKKESEDIKRNKNKQKSR